MDISLGQSTLDQFNFCKTDIRGPGYQEVDIRISEHQAEKEFFVWSPDSLVS